MPKVVKVGIAHCEDCPFLLPSGPLDSEEEEVECTAPSKRSPSENSLLKALDRGGFPKRCPLLKRSYLVEASLGDEDEDEDEDTEEKVSLDQEDA